MTINRLDLQAMISPGMNASVQIYEGAEYRSLAAKQVNNKKKQNPLTVLDKVADLEDKLIRLVGLSSNPDRYLETLVENLNSASITPEDKASAMEAIRRVKVRLASADK
jgi:hypothetical protein